MQKCVPGEGECADLHGTKAKHRMCWDAADMERAAWFRQLKVDLSGVQNRLKLLILDNLKGE